MLVMPCLLHGFLPHNLHNTTFLTYVHDSLVHHILQIYMHCLDGHRKDFFQGGQLGEFSKIFLKGDKV